MPATTSRATGRPDPAGVPAQPRPPALTFSDAPPSRVIGVAVVALPVLQGADGAELGPGAAELVEDLAVDLASVVRNQRLTGEAGSTAMVPLTRPTEVAVRANPSLHTVLLVGVGDASPDACRRAGAAMVQAVPDSASVATTLHAVGGPDCLAALVEGVVLGSFSFTLRTDETPGSPRRVVLAQTPDPDEDMLARSRAMAQASWHARELATVPANIKNPAWLADRAVAVAEATGLKVRVWDEKQLEKGGFGGITAVGRASCTPPRLVQLEYRPRRGNRQPGHVVLVGKGITFDSGGLSLKPGPSMVNMKRDMTGAAVVLSVLGALAELDCPLRVTGLLAIAENAVGGAAMRPGDVLRQYGGRTTEVVNTDAEGRLVLADALAYADDKLAPDVVVDVATLTGAVKVALGLHLGGLMATDDALADRFLAAGDAAGEPLWRLPLARREYEHLLSSKVADAINAPTTAPAIAAALFLQPFTGGRRWAHLDIASVGDAFEDDFEWTKGPTGFGVRLLLRWLTGEDPLPEDRPA